MAALEPTEVSLKRITYITEYQVTSSTPQSNELIARFGLKREEMQMKVNQNTLVEISSKITNWENIAAQLHLDPSDRENIGKKNSSETTKGLHALERWTEKLGKDATYYCLIGPLIKAGRKDLAEMVCELYIASEKGPPPQTIKHEVLESITRRDTKNEKDLQPQFNTDSDNEVLEYFDRSSSSEILDGDSSTIWNFSTKSEAWWNCYRKKCYIRTLLPLYTTVCITGMVILVFSAVAETKYPAPALPSGREYVGNDTVLLLEYNPSGIGSIVLLVNNPQNIIRVYNNTCESFINQMKFINGTYHLNISSDQQIYTLGTYYLLEGSNLEYSLDAQVTSTYQNSTCLLEINVFDDYLQYTSFLTHAVSTSPPKKKCLSTEEQLTYRMVTTKAGYYFVVLFISSELSSQIDSIAYDVMGSIRQYNLYTDRQPISCLFKQEFLTSCTITPEQSGTQKSCIVAKSLSNSFIEISYGSVIDNNLSNIRAGIYTPVGILASVFIVMTIICALIQIIVWCEK